VKLNEAGPAIEPSELDRLEEVVVRQLAGAAWLLLCGSIPPSVPPDFYARLLSIARRKKVSTLLDTDGEALRLGIEAAPTVVTPNQPEAERLLSTALLTRAHLLTAAKKIHAMGARSVILSLGGRGAIYHYDGSWTSVTFDGVDQNFRPDSIAANGPNDIAIAGYELGTNEDEGRLYVYHRN